MINESQIKKIFNDYHKKTWRPSGATISITQMKSRLLRPATNSGKFKIKIPLIYDFKGTSKTDRLRTEAHGDTPIHGGSSMDTYPRRPIDDNS